jgi:uncharacterized RDD family membrane protein YckC
MLTAGKSNSTAENGIPGKGTARWRSPISKRENRMLDTTMRVTTPENISFNYQITGPFRRVFAYGLDILISLGAYFGMVLAIYLLMAFAILPLAALAGGSTLVEAIMGALGGLIAVGYFIVYWFYGAYMETYFNGQTLGKRILKMRVISTDGSAIDGVQATLRNFFRLLDIMPLVPFTALLELDTPAPGGLPTCLFGLVIMTLSRRFQRLGDLVADTVVVTEEKKRHPNLATFLDERVPQLAELIPTSFVVSGSLARVIADYVDQRKFLPFQRASETAGYVAAPLIEKFGLRPDTDHDLFLCALYYKTFASAENGEGGNVLVPVPGASIGALPQPVATSDGDAMGPVAEADEFKIDEFFQAERE